MEREGIRRVNAGEERERGETEEEEEVRTEGEINSVKFNIKISIE